MYDDNDHDRQSLVEDCRLINTKTFPKPNVTFDERAHIFLANQTMFNRVLSIWLGIRFVDKPKDTRIKSRSMTSDYACTYVEIIIMEPVVQRKNIFFHFRLCIHFGIQ